MLLDHLTPEKISSKLASLPNKRIQNQFLKIKFNDPVKHAAVLIDLNEGGAIMFFCALQDMPQVLDVHINRSGHKRGLTADGNERGGYDERD